jgi:hypothetical protein
MKSLKRPSTTYGRQFTTGRRDSTVGESWEFRGDGESVSFHAQFERGKLTREKSESHVYSRVKPQFSRIYRYLEGVDPRARPRRGRRPPGSPPVKIPSALAGLFVFAQGGRLPHRRRNFGVKIDHYLRSRRRWQRDRSRLFNAGARPCLSPVT